MRIVIGVEEHNRIAWEARSPLLRILAGVLVATVFLVVLLVPSPSPARWRVVGGVVGSALAIAAILTLTTPLTDSGHLERLPDGGDVERIKTWPLMSPRSVLQLPLDEIVAFVVETADFEEAAPRVTTLSRLRIQNTAGAHMALTAWAEPSSVLALGEALAKAGRRELVR
jgi:hypothetical protein